MEKFQYAFYSQLRVTWSDIYQNEITRIDGLQIWKRKI